jgi:hypothetical protein
MEHPHVDFGRERTSTRADTALWMLTDDGGSRARLRTSSMDVPTWIFMILMRSARSERLSLIISGCGWSAICVLIGEWESREA